MCDKGKETTSEQQTSTTQTTPTNSNLNNNQFSMTTHHALNSNLQGMNHRPYSLSASNILPLTSQVSSSINTTLMGPMSQFPNFNSYSSFQTVNPTKNTNPSINYQSLVPYGQSNNYSSYYNNNSQQLAVFGPNSFRFNVPSFTQNNNPSSTSFFTQGQQQSTFPLMPNMLSYQQTTRFPAFPISNSSSSLSSQNINPNRTNLFAPSEQDLLDSEFLNLLDDIKEKKNTYKSNIANGSCPNTSSNSNENTTNHETTKIPHSNSEIKKR